MNKYRRIELKRIISELETLKGRVESVKDEEEQCLDALPDSLRYGENGDKMELNVSDLDDCVDNISDVIDKITEVIER